MLQENENNWLITSMTGMGQALVGDSTLSIDCSIKSVNQKGLDIKCRLGSLSHFEPLIGKIIAQKLNRGRIDVEVSLNYQAPINNVGFDEKKAHGLLLALNNFYERLEGETILPLSMGDLISLPGVIAEKEEAPKALVKELLIKALNQALEDLLSSRLIEGQSMAINLRGMLNKSQSYIKEISDRCTNDVSIRFLKLKSRCDELFSGYNVSLERIYQESALLAERSDFTEELDRLVAHVDFFKATCALADCKGRKLDFLCQEMLRESNTLLSKAFDHSVSIIGIELKAEIEKIREQVQNIE